MRTIQADGWIVSVFYFTIQLIHILCTTHQVTYASVTLMFMDTPSAAIFTYHRVKYIKYRDVRHNIFENFDYIDNCYRSVDSNVPCVNVQILYIVYVTVAVISHVCYAYTLTTSLWPLLYPKKIYSLTLLLHMRH